MDVNKSRMLWVDSMRGFSMLIVVFGHVMMSMGVGGYSSFLSSVLLTFRMPLFFFVSGFFSFRALMWWNKQRVADILKRKCQAQIICTIIFLFVYQIVMSGGVSLSDGFGGYWFTIVLFQMYIIYLILSLVSRIIHKDIILPVMLLLSAMGIMILACFNRDSWLWNFLCWENLTKYMQFFTLGIMCSKYKQKFFSLLDNNLFRLTVIVGWIVCMILWYNLGFKNSQPIIYAFIHDIVVRYFALMTVIIMFSSNKNMFSADTNWARLLRFIGRRTLDIYMIHYFLLPDLSIFTPWLKTGNMVIPQMIIGLIITSAIVACCLLISSILRKSRYLESWLFGVKVPLKTLSNNHSA